MLKFIVVSGTIILGGLIGILSTGQATPEDIDNWVRVSTERVQQYVTSELGGWVAQQATPIVSAGMTLLGCMVYALLFRKYGSEEPAKVLFTQLPYDLEDKRRLVTPQGGSGTAPIESEAVSKARARTLKTQLIVDKLSLQAKQKYLQDKISTVDDKKETAKNSRDSYKKMLEDAEKRYQKLVDEFNELEHEFKKSESELQVINEELEKLKNI